MPYESLLKEADQHGIYTYEKPLRPSTKGLYSNKVICINRNVLTTVEKACILAEEIGHYHTTVGDILDQTKLNNRKQEKRARNWAYERRISLADIVEASMAGVKGRHELAEYLDVTESFLEQSIKHYQEKYGLFVTVERYTIYFDPLAVLEMFG